MRTAVGIIKHKSANVASKRRQRRSKAWRIKAASVSACRSTRAGTTRSTWCATFRAKTSANVCKTRFLTTNTWTTTLKLLRGVGAVPGSWSLKTEPGASSPGRKRSRDEARNQATTPERLRAKRRVKALERRRTRSKAKIKEIKLLERLRRLLLSLSQLPLYFYLQSPTAPFPSENTWNKEVTTFKPKT